MKKSLLLAAAAFLALTGTAHAQYEQQATYKEEGTISPLSGVYAGGFGGFSWADAELSGIDDLDVNGGDYGLFVGYQLDTLLDRTLGLGINGALEFHYAWSDGDESTTVGGTTFTTEKNNEWGISFRPGMSWVYDYTLGLKPYAILGYKRAEFETSGGGFSGDETFDGFELGLGTELIAFGDFGVRAEYAHTWYGEEDGVDPDEDTLRLGVAYHF
jgi:opacity protein-like surface antigen